MKICTTRARFATLSLALGTALSAHAQLQLKEQVVTASRVATPVTDELLGSRVGPKDGHLDGRPKGGPEPAPLCLERRRDSLAQGLYPSTHSLLVRWPGRA